MAAFSSMPVAHANDFINGGFETGDLTGWTQGSGTWIAGQYDPAASPPVYIDPTTLTGPGISTVVSTGFDPVVTTLPMVYAGNNAVRINFANGFPSGGRDASWISQTVTSYASSTINFAWSAVLQNGGHPADQQAHFYIQVVDVTSGANTVVYTVSYNASSPNISLTSGGALYSGWQAETVAVTQGHDYKVTLLAADCSQGGHYGYVYLDGFGLVSVASLLGPSGPSLGDTQASLSSSSSALKNIFNLQSGVLTSGLGYDCSLFNEHGVCVSGGGRYTNANGASNSTGALLIAAYRVNDHLRIGGYLDEDLHNRTPQGLSLTNNGPLAGLFAVWQQNAGADAWGGRQTPNGQGWGARAAIGYSDKDVTVSRSIIGTSEAGVGKAGLTSQAAQFEVTYGKLLNDKVLLTPYAGIRYSKVNRDGYTEASSADVTAPLTYAALAQEQTTALLGLRAFTQLGQKVTAYAGVGVEQDLSYKGGNYSATGVTGLTDFNFNQDIARARPVASLGASYATKDKQRVNLDFFYKKEAFSADNIYSAMATYTVGF